MDVKRVALPLVLVVAEEHVLEGVLKDVLDVLTRAMVAHHNVLDVVLNAMDAQAVMVLAEIHVNRHAEEIVCMNAVTGAKMVALVDVSIVV